MTAKITKLTKTPAGYKLHVMPEGREWGDDHYGTDLPTIITDLKARYGQVTGPAWMHEVLAGTRQPECRFTHVMEPYGQVVVDVEKVEEREVPAYGYNGREQGTRKATFVVGTVATSAYCGALWGGVPVRTPDSSRYPVGSHYEVEARPNDLLYGLRRDIAM